MSTLQPRTPEELAETIRWAIGAGAALEVRAGGSKSGLGRPVQAAYCLDVRAFAGIVSYEPAELVLTAGAATPLEDIAAALAEHRQCLAFEPPLPGTLGGVLAAGLSGPRRPKAGAARDHVLGVVAVSGRGEAFTAGGKVVKNVTGYDLPKLLAGSHGTLAVMTEITVKVLPAPEEVRTLLILGTTSRQAVRLMTEALQSPAEISGACHLPPGVVLPGRRADEAVTALRLEGVGPSVESRLAGLRAHLQRAGAHEVLDRERSLAFWRAIGAVEPFAGDGERILWRVSVPPASGGEVLERLLSRMPKARGFLDWGGGLIWLLLPDAADSCATLVRDVIGAGGGHATLVRAPEQVRATTEVFQPQPAALAALSRRVKAQFDPARVLNPGRMYAGV